MDPKTDWKCFLMELARFQNLKSQWFQLPCKVIPNVNEEKIFWKWFLLEVWRNACRHSPPCVRIQMECVHVYVDVLQSTYTLLLSYAIKLSSAPPRLPLQTHGFYVLLSVLTLCVVELQTRSIFSSVCSMEVRKQRERGPCCKLRREELFTGRWHWTFEGAVENMINESFVALNWKDLVPLPVRAHSSQHVWM